MTTLPKVTVTRLEAGNGWFITCDHCPMFRTVRWLRPDADYLASQHRLGHTTPDVDEVA